MIPIAAIRSAPPTCARRPRCATASWLDQIASGSWVTWPGDGNCCSNGCWATATGRPSRPNAIARDDVVPWSRARISGRRSRRQLGHGSAVLAPGRLEVALDLGAPAGPRPSRAPRRGSPRPAGRSTRRGPAAPGRAASAGRGRRRASSASSWRAAQATSAWRWSTPLAERHARSSSRAERHHLRRLAPVAVREPARDPRRPRGAGLRRAPPRRRGAAARGSRAIWSSSSRGAAPTSGRSAVPDRPPPRLRPPERRVDHVAGHDPVGRVLAARDPDEAARVGGDAVLARRLHGRAAGVADERPHAGVRADDVAARQVDVDLRG